MNNPPRVYFIETIKGIFSVQINASNKIQKLNFPNKKLSLHEPFFKQPDILRQLASDLNNYFKGGNINFSKYEIELDGTDFQQLIWNKIKLIPYGSTISYGELAQAVSSKAYQAIGSACGKNPVPIIIPCHRVMAKNNKIGGFSSGLYWKKFLLSCEQNKKMFYN